MLWRIYKRIISRVDLGRERKIPRRFVRHLTDSFFFCCMAVVINYVIKLVDVMTSAGGELWNCWHFFANFFVLTPTHCREICWKIHWSRYRDFDCCSGPESAWWGVQLRSSWVWLLLTIQHHILVIQLQNSSKPCELLHCIWGKFPAEVLKHWKKLHREQPNRRFELENSDSLFDDLDARIWIQ